MESVSKKRELNAPPEPVYTFKGSQAEIHSFNFLLTSKEEKLLVGTRESKIHLWDFQIRRQVHELSVGENGACISVLNVDDQHLITHVRGENVSHWLRTEDGCWVLDRQLGSPGLAFCGAQLLHLSDGNHPLIVHPLEDTNNVGVVTMDTGTTVHELKSKKEFGNVMGLCSAGPDKMLALFELGVVGMWDVKAPKEMLSVLKQQNVVSEEGFAAMCLNFDPMNGRGVVGSSAANLGSFSMNEAGQLEHFLDTPISTPGTSAIACRKDGKLIAIAGWDSRVRLFSWRPPSSIKSPLRPLCVLESHTGDQSLQCCAFSPSPVVEWGCENLLAAAGEGRTVCFWDVYSNAGSNK